MTSTPQIADRSSSYALLAVVVFTLGAVAGLSNVSRGEIDLLSLMAMGSGVGAWAGGAFALMLNRDLERVIAGGAAIGMLGLGLACVLALVITSVVP